MPISVLVRPLALMAAALLASLVPAAAQMQTVDPNTAMQADLAPVPGNEVDYGTTVDANAADPAATVPPAADAAVVAPTVPAATVPTEATYQDNDVFAAAEGVFGKGAEGLAGMLEKILADQGRPNAYISGREAGGAIAIGVRYGSGTMFHKIEGERPVYWTGPSVGFDLGANGSKTFVLVYNLLDSQELYTRFPAVEGTVYVVGGFTASYLRRGDIVLIPIRLGVGWRLGANIGYMKFTEKSDWLPF